MEPVRSMVTGTACRALALAALIVFAGGCPKPTTVTSGSDVEVPRPPSVADPSFLAQYAETYRFSLGKPSGIRLAPDGDAVLFLRSGPRSFVRDLYSFDPATGEERVLLTAEKILAGAEEKLSDEEKARRERMRLAARGIAGYTLSDDGKWLLVPLSGRLFVVERGSGAVKELESEAGYPIDPQFSPDATKVTCVRGGDVYVIDVASGREKKLTKKSSDTITYGTSEFVAQEEMGRYHGTWWSPDGKHLVVQETDLAGLETFHILDPMHPDKAPTSWPYPRPGKKNAAVRLGVIPAAGGKTVWVDWDRERWPYLATVRWKKDAPLTVVVQNRHQTELVVLKVDPRTGKTTTLLEEKDEAWINLDQGVPRWLTDGSGFLWTSERSGSWQLELRDPDGKLVRTLTPPDFGYRGMAHVDDEGGSIYFTGGPEPTESHVYRVSLTEPGTPEPITEGRGFHSVSFSKNGALTLRTKNLLSGEVSWTVLKADGTVAGEIASKAEEPPFEPNVEMVTVGEREFRAAVVRPRNFEAGRRYPVIVYVYGGPHAQMVTATRARYLLHQWFADHGFIVVSIDGRGTPGRGREWERVIRGNFIDVPLEDQAAALAALGARFPEMDLTRVGIFGWSFGGYFSAMAVMRRGDIYHAGVAGAPVADWHDYDTHYTERYIGLPEENPDGYAASSVLTHVDKLERPLLVMHGTADDNVYFMHAIKMSDALFRAGKKHDFLPMSGFTHMVPDPLVTTRLYSRIIDHFLEHLLAE